VEAVRRRVPLSVHRPPRRGPRRQHPPQALHQHCPWPRPNLHCRRTAISSGSHRRRWANAVWKGCASTALRSSRRNMPRSAPAKGSTTWNLRRGRSGGRRHHLGARRHRHLDELHSTTPSSDPWRHHGRVDRLRVDALHLRRHGSSCRLVPTPRPGLSVGVANGDRVPTSGVCVACP